MASDDQQPGRTGRANARPLATDPVSDALVRREEEFRRFLVSVATPALDELRAGFRADGREARAQVITRPGRPAEATLTVSYLGQLEFSCTIHGRLTASQATVLKRRLIPPADDGGPPEVGETTVNPTEAQSNATVITRAEVVMSVRTDYWVLRQHAR